MLYNLMIDPPSPFAPEAEQQAFIRQNEGSTHPVVKQAVAKVREQLAERLFDPTT